MRSEPMYGTAPRVRTWLLVEYPGIWLPEAIGQSTFDPLIKQKLGAIGKTERFHRQLLIRQSHRRSETMRCFIVRSSESKPTISQVNTLTCDGPISTLNHPEATAVAEPMFLVCTHGNHDKCCAKFGLPVYQAARNLTGDQAWECSHVGGDRFAGNLLCFPHGVYYGHVEEKHVPSLVKKYTDGELDLNHYRGRCCYPKAVQVAEYFVRKETGITAINDLAFDRVVSGEGWQVRFRSAASYFDVRLRAIEGAEEYLTCNALTPSPTTRYELSSFAEVTL